MTVPTPALLQALSGLKSLVVLAAGSPLRGDDAAGLLTAEELEKHRPALPAAPALHIFFGETAPENFTGSIRALAPSHVLLIDAADMGQAPGYYRVLNPGPSAGAPGSTHKMPMQVLVDYIHKTIGSKVVIVGIQPGDTRFGSPVCPAVTAAVATLAADIAGVIKASAQVGPDVHTQAIAPFADRR